MDKKFLVIYAIAILECFVIAIICAFLPVWARILLTAINAPLGGCLLDYIDDNL